jgi:hypothetical protein
MSEQAATVAARANPVKILTLAFDRTILRED